MNTKGKILLLAVLCAVMTFVCLKEVGYDTVADENLIRFHVIANSDSLYDQSVKLKVRDGVIEEVNQALKNANSTEEAKKIIKAKNSHFVDRANQILKGENCGYTAKAVIGTSIFPTKTYGDLTLPAGKYQAYRLILGSGEGKNWWCVLYPPLCFVDVTDEVAVAVTTVKEAENEKGIVKAGAEPHQIQIRSKLLEMLSK